MSVISDYTMLYIIVICINFIMFALAINVYYLFSQYVCVCLVHSVHLCVPLVTNCWYTIFTMQCTISACIVNLSSSLIYMYNITLLRHGAT